MGIKLTYDIAMAAGKDAGMRSMREAGRCAWNEEDYNVMVDRVDHLAIVFYRANCQPEYGPIDLREAHWALSQTRSLNSARARCAA